MSRCPILLVLFVAALILTFSSTRVVMVLAQGSPALRYSTSGNEYVFSISGNEYVSHYIDVDVGDTFSMEYGVRSFNESSCVTISASFESGMGASQHPYFFGNKTSIGPNSFRLNGTAFTASSKGTIMVSYVGCSLPCEGRLSIGASYSVQTSLVQEYVRTTQMWAPALAGLFTGGFGFGYIVHRFRARKFQRSTTEKQPPSTSPS